MLKILMGAILLGMTAYVIGLAIAFIQDIREKK
jgi:hypothetical protein